MFHRARERAVDLEVAGSSFIVRLPRMTKTAPIVPVILAAGSSPGLPFPKPLARFGARTALGIAVGNCRGLARAVVVLGCEALAIRPAVPRGVRVVLNRRWRLGQLSSLVSAFRLIPERGAFLIYPVDQPLLDSRLIRVLVREFRARRGREKIVAPEYRGELGHPVIVSMELADEFRRAKTAREVIYRDSARVRIVRTKSPAVSLEFSDPASYASCLRLYRARSRGSSRTGR